MSTSGVEIKIVNNRKLLRTFIELPEKIQRKDPLWVPQIRFLERLDYYHGKNAVLSRSKHCLLLACRNGKAAGRIIAYIDPRYNEHYKASTGFFGAFESEDDPAISEALFEHAEKWFFEQTITEVRGPIDPVAECWGFLLEGTAPPVFMSPHNPLYYNKLTEASGYSKVKDLLVYDGDCGNGYKMPDRLTNFTDRILLEKTNFTVRRIDSSKIDTEAVHILRILNTAVSGNWGFVPVGEDEMKDLVAKLKLIVDEDAIWFVEDEGVPIGCALGYPDINVLIKRINGRLLPFGFIRFLRGLKKLKDYRLWGLAVMPEYQGQGLDVLLYVSLFRALKPKNIRLEANYVLEDNMKIINALKKLNLNQIKTYRVYEKKLKV
jgi:ribosomal protein S18 acetylase RimI-like enzyme